MPSLNLKFTLSLFLFILMTAGICSAAVDETFVQKIRSVSLGMRQEEVLAVLGEPQGVQSKYADRYGRFIEVWRYVPVFGPAEGTVIYTPAGTISTGPTNFNQPDRIKKEMDFWSGVQKASTSNPADPFYKPTFRKLPPSSPYTPFVGNRGYYPGEIYFVTFADGAVQSVVLNE